MLKFLTHKLRTHSLNESVEKVEERDSGTESDDEAERPEPGDLCTDVIMKWNDGTDMSMSVSGAEGPCPAPALPPRARDDQLYDHHSSEEELEVINLCVSGCGASRRRGASSPPRAAPEKRKWAARRDDTRLPAHASDDDDDTKVETPVRFRTSPPLEALKPRRALSRGACACAPPPAAPGRPAPAPTLRLAPALPPPLPLSPRRRRAALPERRDRPALDFDKMQQLKVGSVSAGAGARAWRALEGRHGAGGELSVFCW